MCGLKNVTDGKIVRNLSEKLKMFSAQQLIYVIFRRLSNGPVNRETQRAVDGIQPVLKTIFKKII